MKTLLKNATIVTMNSRQEILKNTDLLIEDDRIKALCGGAAYTGDEVDEVIDCSSKFIMPGLVSAHTHLTGMFQRGLWNETSFEPWTRKSGLTEKFFNLSADDIHTIHSAASIELIRHGVTTVLNMFTALPNDPLRSVNSACRALVDTGIRGILGFSLKDQAPDNPGMVPEITNADSWISLAREVFAEVASFGSRVSLALAPSAPQRCSDRLLIACRLAAEELNVIVHTHLAETKNHADIGRELYGEPIVHHLAKIGFLNPALSAAHAIWLDDQEIDILKKHDVKIVHNPSSNMKLGSGVARVKTMLNKGVTVGLGADSVNAGTTYSIFEQIKLAVLLPRAIRGAEDWVLPTEALLMATMGGAQALRLDPIIGSIEEGKKADLVILNPYISLVPNNGIVEALAFGENGSSVETVFVDGQLVMRDKTILTVDEQAVLAKVSAMEPRIARAKADVLKNL